jgi:hypothetical protein
MKEKVCCSGQEGFKEKHVAQPLTVATRIPGSGPSRRTREAEWRPHPAQVRFFQEMLGANESFYLGGYR